MANSSDTSTSQGDEKLFPVQDAWSAFTFSQSNPAGSGQGDVAALLRRVADSLDELGDVQIQDITFHSRVSEAEDDLTVTVYYHRKPRNR